MNSTRISVAAVVSRLSPIAVLHERIPRFTTSPDAIEAPWSAFVNEHSGTTSTLQEFLARRLRDGRTRCIFFGEQHHQPRVLAAQLSLITALATPPLNYRVTILMEHFNLAQQDLLAAFASDGDAQALRDGYEKSREGFRLTPDGYLPLLQLARELDNVESEVRAGFPPREWARLVMRGGENAIKADEHIASTGLLAEFNDRWPDLLVSPEHSSYIQSMIKGGIKPAAGPEAKQGGLNAAQAFKDSVLAWKADQVLNGFQRTADGQSPHTKNILVVISGAGHCEYRFGAPERLRSCAPEEALLLVTKPDDGTYWAPPKEEDEANKRDGSAPLADGIILYEAQDV